MLLASLDTYLTLPSSSLGKAPASQTEGADFIPAWKQLFFMLVYFLLATKIWSTTCCVVTTPKRNTLHCICV